MSEAVDRQIRSSDMCECGDCSDKDYMALEREIDSLRHEVHTFEEAFKGADFRATDYSQRIMAAVAVIDELLIYFDWETTEAFTKIRAALKLGDD